MRARGLLPPLAPHQMDAAFADFADACDRSDERVSVQPTPEPASK
jgi:hypothetical protein